MDRGSLSDARVIEATRKFVCIRLATYEDAAEAKFLKKIYRSRSGELENTVFVLLSSDAKQKLCRAERSPDIIFRSPSRMTKELNRIANENHFQTVAPKSSRKLPFIKSIDLALNVASAEQLPLAILFGPAENRSLEAKLLSLTEKIDLKGQFVFASAEDAKELKPLTGEQKTRGLIFVEPGKFGLQGQIRKHFGSEATQQDIENWMRKQIETMPRVHKDHHSHVRSGIELGLEWESEIPESDPQSVRARQRARGK